MFPHSLFEIAGKTINLYVVIYVVAVAPALLLGLYLARRRGSPASLGLDGALVALAGAWLGSRVFFAFQWYFTDPAYTEQSLAGLLLEGGQASMGAWRECSPPSTCSFT